ncbi:MAG: hypothetical protein CL858_13390 [Cupriavidus sp.]|nr:hypothetical protein [Cupriavidus sp.]
MSLIRRALQDLIHWANDGDDLRRHQLEAEQRATAIRAEKLSVYTALLNQYWTWQLEVLKHLAFVNGLGLAAAATIVAGKIDKLGFSFGGWFLSFFIGLASAIYGLIYGMQLLRKMREDQIKALDSEDGHPEMSTTKVSTSMKLFMIASLGCFGLGVASIVVTMQSFKG